MKKLYLFMCCLFVLITACTSEEPTPDTQSNDIVHKQYEQSKKFIRIALNDAYNEMNSSNVRSEHKQISPSEYLQFITNMPQTQLDSLTNIYCPSNLEMAMENHNDMIYDKLMSLYSAEEVSRYYAFVDEYVEMGGNNMSFLQESCQNLPATLQLGMCVAAATVDEMAVNITNTRANTECILKVLKMHGIELGTDAILLLANSYMGCSIN